MMRESPVRTENTAEVNETTAFIAFAGVSGVATLFLVAFIVLYGRYGGLFTASLDEACTVGVSVRIGFGDSLATAPADQASAVGTVFSHPGLVPGAQYGRGDGSGILGVGADGEDLSITAEVPTGGSGKCVVSYYTIES